MTLGDQTQIRQFLINVVLNAMEAVADLRAAWSIISTSLNCGLNNGVMAPFDRKTRPDQTSTLREISSHENHQYLGNEEQPFRPDRTS